jgi:hypothetical protein
VAYLLILSAIALLLDVFRGRSAIAPTLTAAPLEVAAPAATRAPAAEANYFGNTNTYKFHRKACRYAGCKNCTAKFASRDEAIAAGYRPCGICDP